MDISIFINSNAATVYCTASDTEFEAMFAFDDVTDKAYPVLVYMLNNEAVAWYDLENSCGFIDTKV